MTFEIFDFQKSEKIYFFRENPKNIFKKMKRSKKIFFGRVEIFFEHQGIRKILLRIECAHSQRSKITLKHTFKESRKKYMASKKAKNIIKKGLSKLYKLQK